VEDSVSIFLSDVSNKNIVEESVIQIDNSDILQPELPACAVYLRQAGTSTSCFKTDLEARKPGDRRIYELLHRLEHRKTGIEYCDAVAHNHPFALTMHHGLGVDDSSTDRKIVSSNKLKASSCTTTTCLVDPDNHPKDARSSKKTPNGLSTSCAIETNARAMAPTVMDTVTQQMCSPRLPDQQAALFRYYNEAVPEHFEQLSPTDVFSSDFGNIAHSRSDIPPTFVTAAPESWRNGKCWLSSEALTEFICLVDCTPPNLGLKPLSVLVNGFIHIMSPNHMHFCSSMVQWADIKAAIQCAMDILDDDMLHIVVILLMANISDVPFRMMQNKQCSCWMNELWWDSHLRDARPDIYHTLAIFTLDQPNLDYVNRVALRYVGIHQDHVSLPAWIS
jgi:hypothetical protein